MPLTIIDADPHRPASADTPLPQVMESLGAARTYGADEVVYRQDEPAGHWYLVIRGAARKCVPISDGRRQIVDFLLPGDWFGFEARLRRECWVECVAPGTKVIRYPRSQMESLIEARPELALRVCEIAFCSIARLQARMILLGRSGALARVCGFLLEMAVRSQSTHEETVALPMSRYDIADYLAIAVETVSRSLTTLRSEGIIGFVDTRHLRIVDRDALEARCRR